MAVDWLKCKGGVWCDLFKLDLNHEYLNVNGVFIVWVGENNERKVLKVGSGNIAQNFAALRKELAIQAFSHLGVKVTWTEASALKRAGIELYLNSELDPTMMADLPKALPIKVPLPWN